MYYTERPDKVGEIAKKIEGHSQSLELDPSTVKYVVNYDERKHFKNIEFTAGHFVGVSVLGKDQKPAFTGSAFFTSDEMFEAKMKLLKEYCENAKDPSQSGGTEMNLSEFITLSWGEKSHKVVEAVDAEYSNEYFTLPVDMFDDRAIMRFYSYIDGSCKLMSIAYSIDENGVVSLGEIKEVHVAYEDVEQPSEPVSQAATLPTEGDNGASEPKAPEQAELTPSEPTKAEDTDKDEEGEDDEKKDEEDPSQCSEGTMDDAAQAATTAELSEEVPTLNATSNEELTTVDLTIDETTAALDTDAFNTQPTKVGAVDEQKQEENSSSAPLTDGERAEFETLKREKKEKLLDSYKDYLSEDEYNGFFATIDSESEQDLENKLLKARIAFEEKEQAKVSRPFSLSAFINPTKKYENKESELASYIGDLLQR